MRAGRLRHSVTIEQPVITKDAANDPQTSYEVYVTRRADVLPMRGAELVKAKLEVGEITHKITLRYDAKTALITHKMRVNFRGRILELIAPPVNVGERSRDIELLCVERQ